MKIKNKEFNFIGLIILVLIYAGYCILGCLLLTMLGLFVLCIGTVFTGSLTEGLAMVEATPKFISFASCFIGTALFIYAATKGKLDVKEFLWNMDENTTN